MFSNQDDPGTEREKSLLSLQCKSLLPKSWEKAITLTKNFEMSRLQSESFHFWINVMNLSFQESKHNY